jgi:uncharacterized protein (TIGR00369 family)
MVAELTTTETAWVRTRATPFVTTADGGVRAGVLATLVDVVGGAIAARVLHPDWLATADLTVQRIGPVTGPQVEARGSVLRRGRTTLVIEALVVAVDEDGRTVEERGRPADPVAWASMTFAVLPARDPAPKVTMPAGLPSRWAFTGSGLRAPIHDVVGIEVVDAAAGRVSVEVLPYVHNSFGALQGGVIGMLVEAAGAEALGSARGGDGSDVVVTDLQIAYLALGRVGPVETSARVLEPGADGRCSAVVEVRDRGAEDRLMTVANVVAVPAPVHAGAAP